MISKGFIKSSFIYTVAGTLPMASAIILLPFYIHYLGTDDFGALSIYLAFALLVQIIVTFSFDASIYIHYHEFKDDPLKLSRFVSSAFLLILMISLGVGIVLVLSGGYLFQWVFSKQPISFFPYGLLCVGTGIFQAFFKAYSSLLQTRQKPESFFWSNLLSFSLIALLTIVGFQVFPDSLLGPVGGRLLAAAVSGGWACFMVFKEFGFHFNLALIRASFSFNFYAFVYQLQQWVMNYFDRILISFYLPLSDVGVYDVTMKCLLLIEFIVNGLYTSFLPKVASTVIGQTVKSSTLEINRYYNGLTAVIMLLVSFCILSFPVLINSLITKKEYLQAIQYIPYVAIIYLFKGMRLYFGIPYGVLKYTKPLPAIYLVVSAVKIVGLIVLIGYFGIYGVILSSLVSYWIEISLLYNRGLMKFRYTFNALKLILAPVALAIMIGSLELAFGQSYPFVIHSFYLLASLVLILWAFRKEIKYIDPLKILR